MTTQEQQERKEQIELENAFILQDINNVISNFSSKIEEIRRVINYINSKEFQVNLYPKIPLIFNNPFEDVCHYRYIIAVEYFKVVSRAIAYKYYVGKNKYDQLNNELLEDEKVKDYLKISLNLRNDLAHDFIGSYLKIDDLSFDDMLERLEQLRKMLEVYVAFVKSKSS